jgi:GTPase SAR1 family protein
MSGYINHFSLDTVRLPLDRIIDRERQLHFLNDRVLENNENVLITGPFGIGKTCLLRKFRAGIRKNSASPTLIIEMEMRRVSADVSDFLSDVLLKLIGVFWEEVLNRPYSELIKAVTNPADVRELVMPQVKRVLELYRIIRPEKLTADLEEKNVVGLDKVVKATKEERVGRKVERGDLRPSEFVSLATEILEALHDKGFERTVIFGDEANHIDPDIEIDIIRRNFEVFASKNVQFVLTAQAEVLQKVPRLKDAFPAWLDVKPFENPKILEEFIATYSAGGRSPSFSPRCQELIWEISRGHPREIQRICQECVARAILRAEAGGSSEIGCDILVETMTQIYELRPR